MLLSFILMPFKMVISLGSSEPANRVHIYFHRKLAYSFWVFSVLTAKVLRGSERFQDISIFSVLLWQWTCMLCYLNVSYTLLGYFKCHLTVHIGSEFWNQIINTQTSSHWFKILVFSCSIVLEYGGKLLRAEQS